MPAGNDIDWPGIRAAAVALQNVRAAARQAGANLPEPERTTLIERINKRALREGWLDKAAAVQAVHSAETALSKPVQNGHQIMENTLKEGAKETRLGLTKYAARMAREAGDAGTLEQAPLLKAVADIHGKMHPEQQDGDRLTLAFFSISTGVSEGPVIDV